MFKKLWLMVFLALLLSACNTAKKTGMAFNQKPANVSIFVVPPTYIKKTNLKKYPSANLRHKSQTYRDSIQFYQSNYIKYIYDSIFLENFVNAYMDEIRAYGGRSCLDVGAPQCQPTEISYVVNMLHSELKEYVIKYTDAQQIGRNVYEKDIPLEAVSFHLWLEIHPLNDTIMDETPLYTENFIRDELPRSEFFFEEGTDKILHVHSKTPMNPEKIYSMADKLGRKYATYTWDYIMNEYIRQLEGQNTPYLRFDRKSGEYLKKSKDKFSRL
ncbi:MAG: hypothetical protein Q7J34_12785 [Bacteroidales bacterium]|jgi:hypothetical protein|nr:hypothetical protein [Bacteroidales bacterium]